MAATVTFETSPALADSDALQALAAKFARKMDQALQSAEASLSPQTSAEDAKLNQRYDAIPDGEPLLLMAEMKEASSPHTTNYKVEQPITAIKQGRSAYLSFTDFIYVAGLEIKIDADAGNAAGWYAKEGQTFLLDTATHTVKLGDTVKSFSSADILTENGDFYIRDAVLGEWFDFQSLVEPQSQRIIITTNTPLPLQNRLARLRKRKGTALRQRPEKPRIEQEYQILTTPRADVQLIQRYQKHAADDAARTESAYNVLTSNQLLNHEMSGFIGGTFVSERDTNPVEQARINFRKESEDNDLLGPLKAKTYEFNDLVPVLLAGTGSSGAERGVRVSNRSNRYTVDTLTTIDGDAQPGWDVELYRGESFVAGTVSDESGRYSFDNVSLFAGDNRFRIALYGPSGEQVEEERIVTVLPGLIGNIKGYYDLSLTQKDTITYRAQESENEDRGTMRLVGSYDRRVNDVLTLRGGIHTREDNGQRDNYFYSGAVAGLGTAILNADLITTSDGPFQASLLARRNFGRHYGSAGLEYISTDFSEVRIDDTISEVARQSVFGALNGPFMPETLLRVTYDATARATSYEDGRFTTVGTGGLYSYYKGLRFRNELEASTDSFSEEEPLLLQYIGGITGRYAGYFWRGALEYEIIPDAAPESFRVDVDKSYNANLSAFAGIRHLFDNGRTELNTGLTYYAEKARLSPSITYDTDQNIEARLDINFGLAHDPANKKIIMSSRPISTQAGLTVFAFLDKDGDGTFNHDDEPLQDVVINAKQYGIDFITDAKGIAYSGNVPTSRVSDIVMEESSAFDPHWVSGYEGASVLLRPTETARLEFPILRGGEIDGTASIAGATGAAAAARSMNINLVTPDGVVAKTSATPFDGFYVIEQIRPGVYYMTTDSSQSPTTAYRLPEKLIITPEGAQIYGKNIELTRGYDIPFTFTASNANPSLERRTKILKPEDIAREDIYIRLGNYRSGVTLALDWYKFRLRTRGWQNGLTPVVDDFDQIARDAGTSLLPLRLKPAQPLRLPEAALLCERLIDAGFEGCGVDVVTTYHGDAPAAAGTVQVSANKG